MCATPRDRYELPGRQKRAEETRFGRRRSCPSAFSHLICEPVHTSPVRRIIAAAARRAYHGRQSDKNCTGPQRGGGENMNAIRKPLALIVAGLVLGLGAW